MEGNQTSVIESSDGDIKKLIASAVPESTKKSLQYAVNEQTFNRYLVLRKFKPIHFTK